jgi:hypothetical protein
MRSWRDLLVVAVGVYGGGFVAIIVLHADRLYGWSCLVLCGIALVVLLVKDERGWG